jgi:hypothetical protein
MFILQSQGRGFYGEHRYVLGYSEDKSKLQAMIDQYKVATCSTSGEKLHFEQCPSEIVFGKYLLKKNRVSQSYSCDAFEIGYTDYLSIQEVKEF